MLSLLFLWMMFAITLLGGKAIGGISGMITGAITPIVAIAKSMKGTDKPKSEFQEKIEKYNNQLSAKYNKVAGIGSKVAKINDTLADKTRHLVVDQGLDVDTDNVDPTKVHVL